MTPAATTTLPQLPVLGTPLRWKVLRPIHERPITNDRVLMIHPPSGVWVMVRAPAVEAVRRFLDACESGNHANEELDGSPLFEPLRHCGLIQEQPSRHGCQHGCAGARGELSTLILKLVGFCDLACEYCYDFHAPTYS